MRFQIWFCLALLAFARISSSAENPGGIEAQAWKGDPFGVGRITFRQQVLPAALARGIRLAEASGRVLYPVAQLHAVSLPQVSSDAQPPSVSIYFLFRGAGRLQLQPFCPGQVYDPLRPCGRNIEPGDDADAHQRLLQEWWQLFCSRAKLVVASDSYYPMVENYLVCMLGRRLELNSPILSPPWSMSSDISRVFGVLLGTESIRVAMMRDRLLQGAESREAADQPLPDAVAPPPVEIPEADPNVQIEPMAMRVPIECFCVRFGNFANFQWFRSVLDRWGGACAIW